MTDHFTISPSPWSSIQRPATVGHLALDNYDPTFGDGGVALGTDVYACNTCGSLVIDWERHRDWHEA